MLIRPVVHMTALQQTVQLIVLLSSLRQTLQEVSSLHISPPKFRINSLFLLRAA